MGQMLWILIQSTLVPPG